MGKAGLFALALGVLYTAAWIYAWSNSGNAPPFPVYLVSVLFLGVGSWFTFTARRASANVQPLEAGARAGPSHKPAAADAPGGPGPKYCTQCGAARSGNFCPNCGAPFA